MKSRFDRNSLKAKTILYFIMFAIVLMVLLWSLQVLFLNFFYQSMKETQTRNVTRDISRSYETNNMADFSGEVDDIAAENDIFLYISYADGTPFMSVGHKPPQDRYEAEINEVRETMLMQDLTSVSLTITSPKDGRKHLACGNLLVSNDGKPELIAYVISPLWPMSSTINILQRQLFYVTIIALVISLLMALWMSGRISQPLRNITRSAGRMAKGEYGIIFEGGAYTEINELADTLTKASIELEKSTSLQKDLIANVSHDLRTPLTMVKSYAEMVRDLSGDNPVKREAHLQVIIDEADRLNMLVSDMLTLSRMQSGSIVIDRTDFDLKEAVESILSTYALLEEEEGYHIHLHAHDSITVNGDPARIKQVFSNLINNALKFCGDDKTVNINLIRKGRTVLCQVQDHGIGIEEEDIAHIWDRYYKASNNMVRSTHGTGLGLSIVKEILTLHKLRYGVRSTPGKGTTFWFEMKLK